jgi:thiamine biosynthesis lipoprotein
LRTLPWRDIRQHVGRGLAGALLVLVAACNPGPQPVRLSGPAMGTTYSVVVSSLPHGVGEEQIEDAIAAVLSEADRSLSGWNEHSELARWNRSPSTDWQEVSLALFEVVSQARAVSDASGGAFDVTVGPLVRAWGFGAGADAEPAVPSEATLASLLGQVGYARLELRAEPCALRKAIPGLVIDVDGIAPGWAVDRIAGRFDALGIQDYIVELGGEVRARGLSPEGRSWRVAVETPLAGERRAQAVIELDGTGVSTSGDYRDYREIDGRRISHTIDPRTGLPVSHGLASVTVVHPAVAAADAWATALMVLGPQEGLALARREGLAALFIVRGADPGVFVESETPQFARLRVPQPPRL